MVVNPKTETLYDSDYYLWLEKTVHLLREERWQELDILNLVEELEDMGRSQKQALQSNLIILLLHLLKCKYQPQKRTASWLSSIAEHRDRIDIALADSPSLRSSIQEVFDKCYAKARKRAAIETELPLDIFPEQSPFIPEQTLDFDYLPETEERTAG
ncbi:MAG: DUF29 domain-containing protein [Chroococcidiopsidaceae cyanobacterium CP_BM_RX_35]|nr:DUF29 domain-containing protein [Chroococcidiopsidaceae cyanobacterium CP_BM_RX_35]